MSENGVQDLNCSGALDARLDLTKCKPLSRRRVWRRRNLGSSPNQLIAKRQNCSTHPDESFSTLIALPGTTRRRSRNTHLIESPPSPPGCGAALGQEIPTPSRINPNDGGQVADPGLQTSDRPPKPMPGLPAYRSPNAKPNKGPLKDANPGSTSTRRSASWQLRRRGAADPANPVRPPRGAAPYTHKGGRPDTRRGAGEGDARGGGAPIAAAATPTWKPVGFPGRLSPLARTGRRGQSVVGEGSSKTGAPRTDSPQTPN